MNLYLQTGRITKKGEIFELLYQDHMEVERKRLFLETCNELSKELFITLERAQNLLIQETEYFILQKERMRREYEERIAAKDLNIRNLEDSMQKYKMDLEEKIVENAEIRKGMERLQKANDRKNRVG